MQFFAEIAVDRAQNFEFFEMGKYMFDTYSFRCKCVIMLLLCEPFVPLLKDFFAVVCAAEAFSDAVFAILDIQNPPELEYLSEYDRTFFEF